jgi:hypothetical protein
MDHDPRHPPHKNREHLMPFARHDRVKQVFLGALERGGEGLGEYLDRECKSDPELRRDVEALLAVHHDSTVLFGGIRTIEGSKHRGSVERFSRLFNAFAFVLSTPQRRLIAVAVTAFAVLAIGYWLRMQARNMLLSQAASALRAVLDGNATALSIASGHWKSESAAAVQHPAINRALLALITTRSQHDWKRLVPLLTPSLSAQRYHSYFVMTAAGELIATSAGPLEGRATASGMAAIGRMSHRNGTVEFPSPGSDFGEPAEQGNLWPRIVVLTPIRDQQGELLGAFGLVRAMEQVSERMRQGRPFQTGETYLFRENGLLLTPSRFSADVQKWKLAPAAATPDSASAVYLRDPGRPLRDSGGLRPNEDPEIWPLTEVVRVAAARRKTTSDETSGVLLTPYRDYRGVLVIGAWRWIREMNVGLTTEVDEDEILAALRFIDWPVAICVLLLAGAGGWTILSSWLLTRLRVRTLAGEALGQYTLIEKIGEGGVGEVYLAHHAHLRRPAAVKLLRRDRVSPEFLQQFEREAQAASKLRHPNTVEVYDFGVTNDGLPYYVMEFLPGTDLGACVNKSGPMTAARTVHIGKQICSALIEAHQQKIIHRDIKPANVMLCELAGQHDFVKILDFGLARDLAGGDEASPWARSGTPFYTAPERLLPNAAVDHRCDLYSLGALLYFLISAHMPFEPGADWIEATLSGHPVPPSRRVELPASLELLILDCMHRDPAERPGSAREVLQRLEGLENVPAWTRQDFEAAAATHGPPA